MINLKYYIFLIFCIVSQIGFCQTKIGIDDALKLAKEHNLSLKKFDKLTEYATLNTKSRSILKPTTINADIGQINSVYIDNKFTIGQSFANPKLIKSEVALLNHEIEHTQFLKNMKWAEIKNLIYQSYFDLIYIHNKIKLYEQSDSIYKQALLKVDQRISAGEANIIEKNLVVTQLNNIEFELSNLNNLNNELNSKLQYLTNTNVEFIPDFEGAKVIIIDKVNKIDTSSQFVQAVMHLIHINEAEINVEKAKLLPGFSAAYNNTTFKGIGPDDRNYTIGNRFSSLSLGIEIPLFRKSQNARINAMRYYNEVLNTELEDTKNATEIRLNNAFKKLNAIQKNIDLLSKANLSNVSTIMNSATTQLRLGEINYLEWVNIFNITFTSRMNNIETLKNYNDTAIEIIYLSSK